MISQVKICLIFSLKTNVFAFANSFWIIVFFKKLSRNFPLIRSLFTYQFADCFKCLSIFRYALSLSVESVLMYKSTLRSVLPRLRAYRKIYFALKFIWLNFYTMKFSRFKFSVLLNVIILTQPVNIVKRFFLFHQVFIKSTENFRRCCFSTAWLLYQTAYALSRTFLNFFRTFSSRPIRFRVATREKFVCSQATAWLYYHSLLFPSSTFRKLFLKNFIPYSNFFIGSRTFLVPT